MKNSLKLAALAAFISATAFTSQAQTNLVERLGIQLTAISQGATTTNGKIVNQEADFARIGTRDVIKALGAATSNDFSGAAELLRVTPIIDGTNGVTSTVVKDGTNIVDVSGFLAFGNEGSAVRERDSLNRKVLDATRFSIRTLALKNQTGFPALKTSFDVQGFDVAVVRRLDFKNGMVLRGHYATWTVNGTGEHNSKPIILEGEVNVFFDKVVVTGGI